MHVHILNIESMKPMKRKIVGILGGDGPQPPWRHWPSGSSPEEHCTKLVWIENFLFVANRVNPFKWKSSLEVSFVYPEMLLGSSRPTQACMEYILFMK